MPARVCNIAADLELTHANVRVLDYRWNEQERIHERDDEFILRYRPFPARVSLSAYLNNGQEQDFGQLMFFPPQTEINTTPARENELTRNIICNFSKSWFEEVWPDQCDWNEALDKCLDVRNFRLEQMMQRLGLEAASPGFASRLMTEAYVQIIAIEVARYFAEDQGFRPKRVRTFEGRFSTKELQRIYDYVDSFSNRSPTVADISRNCGVSSAHLRRSFKQTTGMTLHKYISTSRLTKAQTLLAESDLPMKEVAFRLGFASPSTFSSTFTREAGETPRAYRQRVAGRA
jgi:AraC family transcriptional regulator